MTSYGDKPYGLHEIVIKKDSTVVAFPISQTLEFEERMVSGELPGDDGLKAVAAHSNGLTWKLGQGGISLEAYALITGRSVSEIGSTPNREKTLAGGTIGQAMPYFDIYGKALGDGDDDIHIHIINAKITGGVKGSLKNKEFLVSEVSGMALDWEIVQDETAQDLPSS